MRPARAPRYQGLDPNFTVNAWGGPTYLGAMASHYLDLLVLMGAAAWMLHLILLPDPRTRQQTLLRVATPPPGAAELPLATGVPLSAGRMPTEKNR